MGRGWNDDNMSSWESKGPGPSLAATKKKNKKQPGDHLLFSGTILMKHHLSPTYNAVFLGSLKKHRGNIGMLLGGDVAHQRSTKADISLLLALPQGTEGANLRISEHKGQSPATYVR